MKDLSINFTIEHNDLSYLQNIFIGEYGEFQSPLLPIYIISDTRELRVEKYLEGKAHSNFLVVETSENSDQGFIEIAYILIRYQSEDEIYVVFQGMLGCENKWELVKKLVQSILRFVYDHGYKIISVFPFNLIPLEMFSAQEKSNNVDNSSSKVPIPKVILGMNTKTDQIDGAGSSYPNSKTYVPKTKETYLKWKKAYKEMNRWKADWEKAYDELTSDDPVPNDDYYREELIKLFGKKVSQKTIQRIRKAGKAGLLK